MTMSMRGLRTSIAVVVLALMVFLTGCGTPAGAPASPSPPRAIVSPSQTTDTADASAPTSTTDAVVQEMPPDQDGHPACPAYDSWRPGPGGAGITVTYWYEGTAPVTVLVRGPDGSNLSQTVEDDVHQRYHDFEFPDVDPKAVTEILITTGTTSCYVRPAPAS